MIKNIVIAIVAVLVLGAIVIYGYRVLDLNKKEAIVSDYVSILQNVTATLDKITDRASLDAEMPSLEKEMARYEQNSAQVRKTSFTIQDAKALDTMKRMQAVDNPMRESRMRVIKLFGDDYELQKKLVEFFKPMPHMQAEVNGRLELEWEFDRLFPNPEPDESETAPVN